VGWNYGYITESYSIGMTRGTDRVGGLVSWNTGTGRVDRSLWDTETSTQQNSNGGIGRKTDAMQTINTFLDQGWDFVGETVNGREDIWLMPYGGGYPILSVIPIGEQILSSTDEIYEIATAADLITLGQRPEDYDKHFILTADIDLDPNLPGRKVFDKAVIAPDTNQGSEQFEGTPFTGIFDGNGHVIRNLHIEGHRHLGLFGKLGIGAIVSNLGVEAVEVSEGSCISGLAGSNSGRIIASYTTGVVTGTGIWVGGLAGFNNGQIKMSYSTAVVTEYSGVGGLVGCNVGIISSCYSSGPVNGHDDVGGLVGYNADPGRIENSYSSSRVSGIAWNWKASFWIGGLIGNNFFGTISTSYSVGPVSGDGGVGGFVGKTTFGSINDCFWDKVTTNQTEGIGDFEFTNNNLSGRTTTEMMRQDTFIIKGWDFVDESENGTDDFWKIWDNYDYPRLIWEPGPNTPLVFVDINDPDFFGQMSKYEVTNAQYCDFLNAALASGDITIDGNDVYGDGGTNSGEDYAGQRYYRCDGSGYTGYGATNGGAARIHYNEGEFWVDEGFGNYPVTYVSWYGAMAFCNYYGYYLPTEDQWQAVADYDGTYIYGCGEIIDPGIANYRNSEHPDGTTSVGSFGVYGYGMSDMAGNVWEWTSSSLDSNRVFRGGSLGSIADDCVVSIRGDGIPYANYWDIGFRVCR